MQHEIKPNIGIVLHGHEARITHIWGTQTNPTWPQPDMLTVWVEFDEPPQGISGMAIAIPAKEYSRDELLTFIKKEGEKQVGDAVTRRIKEIQEQASREQRRDNLEALAQKAAEVLGEGG